MTTIGAPLPARGPVLADLLPAAARPGSPRTRARSAVARAAAVNAALVLTGTLLVAGLSQVLVPLPFTPVPLSLGTLGALLVGAALGPARAAASLGIYLAAGILGVGWFAGGASGWAFASFGYLLGFLAASVVVGAMARRGADRSVWRSIGIGLIGGAIVYAFGVPWLMVFTGSSLGEALVMGVAPFVLGDAIKAAIVAIVLPSAWALLARTR
ncbi:biotin transporter BioY [Serinibacter salmoneus]|uniref:biotin transporter BioY n=1 Tax=Serinibacter salmoneus TaxID=556530 RepID=UPI000BF8E37E|nr:biotin transporter BioY [Serinibacter salmoneus]